MLAGLQAVDVEAARQVVCREGDLVAAGGDGLVHQQSDFATGDVVYRKAAVLRVADFIGDGRRAAERDRVASAGVEAGRLVGRPVRDASTTHIAELAQRSPSVDPQILTVEGTEVARLSEEVVVDGTCRGCEHRRAVTGARIESAVGRPADAAKLRIDEQVVLFSGRDVVDK